MWEISLRVFPQFPSLPLRSERALANSAPALLQGLSCKFCPCPFFAAVSPPPGPLLPNLESRLSTRTPDQIRFSAPRGTSVRCLPTCSANRSSWSRPLWHVPPPRRQSAPSASPPGLRVRQSLPLGSVAWYPAALAGRAVGGVEAEVAAPAPGVGRSRGCSRSGAAASRGGGAAAAPYCGPKRPRPSHGRDLR